MDRNDPPPEDATHRARDLIDEICREIGPRPSGSPAESEASRLLEQRLESWGVDTRTESFSMSPWSLHAFLVSISAGYVATFLLYFVWPQLAAALVTLVFLNALAFRVLDIDVLCALLPKRWSTNVIGRITPRAERRRTVIFAGHHDSAYHMPLLRYPKLFPWLGRLFVMFVVSALALLALAWWRTIGGVPGAGFLDHRGPLELAVLGVCGVSALFALCILFGMIRTDAVPGANDNLSAVAVAWEVARRLAVTPPEHTEVQVVAFGSEEAGLKGSRYFVKRHRAELAGAELVNLESLGQSGTLYVLTGEMLGPVRHSETVVRRVEESAVAGGVSLKRRFLFHGLTDATSFSRQGLPATCVIRLTDDGFLDAYHIPEDAPESIDEERLQEALRLCLGVVEVIDRE